VLPFPNELYSVRITGAELITALEDGIANWRDLNNSNGSHPYASGLRWQIDLTQPRGQRLSDVQVKDPDTGVWAPIDPARSYLGILTDYLTQGFEGYETFKRVCNDGTGRCLTAGSVFSDQSLINHFRQISDQPAPNDVVTRPACSDYSHQQVRTQDARVLTPCS